MLVNLLFLVFIIAELQTCTKQSSDCFRFEYHSKIHRFVNLDYLHKTIVNRKYCIMTEIHRDKQKML